MGREIKFRAWCGSYYDYSEFNYKTGCLGCNFSVEADDIKTIQQYTGLKDKNGTEIYEGDIINVSGHLSVMQCEEYLDFRFWFEPMREFCSLAFLAIYKDFEVVGSIYENPDLLEGGE